MRKLYSTIKNSRYSFLLLSTCYTYTSVFPSVKEVRECTQHCRSTGHSCAPVSILHSHGGRWSRLATCFMSSGQVPFLGERAFTAFKESVYMLCACTDRRFAQIVFFKCHWRCLAYCPRTRWRWCASLSSGACLEFTSA